MLLVFNCVFQIEGSPSPQVSYDLQQLGKLHLWVELQHFSFLSVCFLQNVGTPVSEQSYQVNGKDSLLTCARISIFWELRNPPRQSLMASLGHDFPGLERPMQNSV